MDREEIRCVASGKLLGYISCTDRKLHLFCKHHHTSEEIDLQPYIDRMLAQESKEQGESETGIRLLRVM